MVYAYYSYSDPFESIFHKFNRPFQEVKGWSYEVAEDKKSAKIYINALGVREEDIDLTWEEGEKRNTVIFHVKGETKIDNLRPFNLEQSILVPIPVKTLKKSFVNGLIILELGLAEPSKPEIKVID